MRPIPTTKLSERFLAETEQGINEAILLGVDPESEYLRAIAELRISKPLGTPAPPQQTTMTVTAETYTDVDQNAA